MLSATLIREEEGEGSGHDRQDFNSVIDQVEMMDLPIIERPLRGQIFRIGLSCQTRPDPCLFRLENSLPIGYSVHPAETNLWPTLLCLDIRETLVPR